MDSNRPPRFSELLESLEIPGLDRRLLPRGFQRIGHIAILSLRPELRPRSREIADLMLRSYPHVRTVCLSEGISGELREPRVAYLAGERETETVHRENGCIFRLDVTKVMLSKGNLPERGRIPKLVREGETVLDMFAGIGYFSIPLAVHSRLGKVVSIEKNPSSFRYLEESIRLNRVQGRVTPVLGDCREASPQGKADRIIMGYLPGTASYLPAAFRALRPEGGTIHFHDICHEDDLWDGPLEALEAHASRAGFSLVEVTHKAVVKGYAPRVKHMVIDALFGP